MGFGVSGSTAIIFLGVLIASGSLYTATAGTAEQLTDVRDQNSEDLLDRRNTALDVTSVVYNSSNGALEVDVKNTGTTTLSVNGTTVLVDNVPQQPLSTTVVTDEGSDAGTDVWGAGDTLALEIDVDSTPDRLTAVAENGVAASNSTVEAI